MGIITKRRLCMLEQAIWITGFKKELSAAGVGVVLLAMGGCASEAPKPAPTIMQDQVRSNADKAFEKLKQEEKSRAIDSGVGPY
jgi:ABC-type transporter MlaC component